MSKKVLVVVILLLILLESFLLFIPFILYKDYVTTINKSNKTCILYKCKKDLIIQHKNPTTELVLESLYLYKIKYPQIVLSQAILETGYFTSYICKEYNNLFGLYNSKTKDYYRFEHWSESIIGYINMIEYKYKPYEDYYNFLQRIGYAEDPDYINKVKRIESNLPP